MGSIEEKDLVVYLYRGLETGLKSRNLDRLSHFKGMRLIISPRSVEEGKF